jgi:multiple sugar transport system substrate-binding protein
VKAPHDHDKEDRMLGCHACHVPAARPLRTRRAWLGAAGGGAAALLAGACSAPGQGAAGEAGSPAKTATTTIRAWFHWGAQTGEQARQLLDSYNSTQGAQDKNVAAVETVPSGDMLEKMTAVTVAGDPPDVWHGSISPKVCANGGLTISFPKEEEQYVRQNYIPGAVDRMTLGGKIWGYPTEFQAPAYFYRKSHFQEAGLTAPPTTTDEVFEYSTKLTRKSGGVATRFGFGLNHADPVIASHLPGLIARHGGQMYAYNGDRPTSIDLASPAALEAVGWWKRLFEAGLTQVDQLPLLDSIRNGMTSATEYEVWYTLINIKNPGLQDMYDDLGGTTVAPKRGVKPVAFAGGWALLAPKGSKQPEERWKLMRWMMHKPAMPFSRFIVETVGAIPSPTEYPTKIPGWSDEMIRTFAVDTAKIAQAHPTTRVLGVAEINAAALAVMPAIITGQTGLQTALQELNAKANEILLRNNPA